MDLTPVSTVTLDVSTALDILSDALRRSAPMLALQQAQASLEGDLVARQLLERLARIQSELRNQRAASTDLAKQLEQLHQLQEQVRSNLTIQVLAQAEQLARTSLRDVSAEISQLLGVDFAALAKRSGCC